MDPVGDAVFGVRDRCKDGQAFVYFPEVMLGVSVTIKRVRRRCAGFSGV